MKEFLSNYKTEVLIAIIVYRYDQYIIKKNYLLDVAVACDPAIENCFSAEDAEPYKKVQMLASEAPICLQEHSCEDFKCTAGTSCVITLCSADTLAEGESCTQP